MAALTTQSISRTPAAITYTAASSSDTFTPGAYTFLHIKNAGGSPDNVTITVAAGDPTGLVITDVTFTVPATTGDRIVGPFNPQFFADPVTGLATIAHSFTTSVTVAVLNLSLP